MIAYKTGNLLTEDVEALVNTVNCVGVMGRGVALQFKQAFPKNYKAYATACKQREVKPGRMFVFETGEVANPRYIINFPTKRHWKGKARMEDIDAGLNALVDEIRTRNIHSIAIPPLGSGLGGLNWQQVRTRIETALKDVNDLKAVVFEPDHALADQRINRSSNVPKMTAGRAALVGLMGHYLIVLLDPFVTLLEVHKLMYFMQHAGEQLRLKYAKGIYGPYAENLRHVLRTTEGHLITGYIDNGENPNMQLELVPGALEDAHAFLNDKPDTKMHFTKVSDLIEGFESSFGLELLSTTHWVIREEQCRTKDEVVARVHAWNPKKTQFSPRKIELAVDVLLQQNWIQTIK